MEAPEPVNPFAGVGGAVDPAALSVTRAGLHRLAEHVLAAWRYRWTGRIGLLPAPGGLATPAVPTDDGPATARVDGAELVVADGGTERRVALRTVGEAAAELGVPPAAPPVYPAATPADPDAPLELDPATVRLLAGWWAVGAAALDRVAVAHPERHPGPVTLWPEHFDLAVTCDRPGAGDGAVVNLGVSPGDDDHPLPYAYVGPWPAPAAGADPWWNAPFGRLVPATEVAGVEDLVALFEEGLRRTAG